MNESGSPAGGKSRSRRGGVVDETLTPFGERVRALRHARNLQLKDMAAHLGVTSAYLSALERGERGRPAWSLIQGVIHYFGVIWDEADELQHLAEMSEPRPKIDARGCGPQAMLFVNRLGREIAHLDAQDIAALTAVLDRARDRRRNPSAS